MDVSDILAAQASKHKSTNVEKEIPLLVDAGYLTVTDHNPIDEDAYKENLEGHIQSLARDGVQVLLSSLFSLSTTSTPDGPLAVLPPPTTLLPRAKHLPKPKPPTKWERFASAKGIQKTRKEKRVWDEEKQGWVNRWGMHGKNREKEEQWITEVPMNAPVDFDPVKAARDKRKERISKNDTQRLQNAARAQGAGGGREDRKKEIEGTLATSRISTASMGKFDKKLEGEKKLKGVKRKFEPAELPIENEKKASLALISKLDVRTSKRSRQNPASKMDEESVLNVRKAVRFASRGRGGAALGQESSRGRGGGRGGRTGRKVGKSTRGSKR